MNVLLAFVSVVVRVPISNEVLREYLEFEHSATLAFDQYDGTRVHQLKCGPIIYYRVVDDSRRHQYLCTIVRFKP